MNRLENVTLDKNNPKFHTDIPRLKQGGVGAQVRVEKQDLIPRHFLHLHMIFGP